jgi:hypothetical protein
MTSSVFAAEGPLDSKSSPLTFASSFLIFTRWAWHKLKKYTPTGNPEGKNLID